MIGVTVHLAAPAGMAAPAALLDGIGVVLDPVSLERVGSLVPAQVTTLYVVTDFPADAPSQSMLAYQFGVELDPRLVVISRQAHPAANFVDHASPDDWVVGLGDCVHLDGTPVVLATYQVVLSPDDPDVGGVRVGLRGLTNGEPMMWSACNDPGRLTLWGDAGGCVFNPTSPTIVRFGGAPALLVEGRPFALAWETFGATTVKLDGGTVAVVGRADNSPTQDTTYTLTAQAEGGAEVSQTVDVTVIRTPRIDSFTAEPFELGGTTMARLSWTVRGADRVLVTGLDEVAPISGALVPIPVPPVWVLSASNEWGPSQQTVELGSAGDLPPVISDFYSVPEPFEAGLPVSVRWSVAFADQVDLQPGVGLVEPVGERQLSPPGTTLYTLEATNAHGSRTRSFVAHQLPAGILAFTAEPDTIFDTATPVTLAWRAVSATSLIVDPDVGELPSREGQVVVVPAASKSYRLLASNSESSAEARAAVLASKPLIDIEITNITPAGDTSFTLTVRIRGAMSATLEPGFGNIDPTGITVTTSVSQTTTFTVQATNAFGTSSSHVTIVPQKPYVTMHSTPASPAVGDSVTLNVDILGAVSATLNPGFGAIAPTGGSFRVLADIPRTYTCSATNAVGTTTATHTITPRTPIISFTASPMAPFIDETVTLSVSIQNATSATLLPGIGAIPATGGNFAAMVDSTTVFTVTAYLEGNSVTKSVTVTPKRPQVGLTASSLQPYPIQPITLTVTMRGAVSATLEPGFGSIPVVGSNQFHPTVTTPTTFVVTARNKMGPSTAQVTVIPQPPSVFFGASNSTPYPDQLITLSATVAGASTVTLEPGFGSIPVLGGVFNLRVPTTTTYTLTAVNVVGQTVKQATVTPRPPLVATFAASPPTIAAGQNATLSWSASHADSIQIQPGGYHSSQLNGTLQVHPQESTTYTLNAFNTAGTTTRVASVVVVPFEIVSFSASPSTIVLGEAVTLIWEVLGTADVSLDGIGPVPQSGSQVVYPTADTIYTLRASNGAHTVTRGVEVVVESPPPLWLSWSTAEAPGVRPDLLPFQPFQFHVLALDPPGGVQAYEFGVDVPACVIVNERTIYPQPGAVDFGVGEDNFIVGTSGICLSAPVLLLARYSVITMEASCFDPGVQIGLVPAQPTSFAPAAAGYLACGGAGTLRAFAATPALPLAPESSLYPPAILRFQAHPAELGPGQTTTLSWDTMRATTVTIEPGGLTGLPASGSRQLDPVSDTIYTLTASNVVGTASAVASVVRLPFTIDSFTATPALIAPGGAVTLEWRVLGVAEVSIDHVGSQPMQGSVVVYPGFSTTYRLRARHGALERVATAVVTVSGGLTSGALALSWSQSSVPGNRPAILPFVPFTFYALAINPPGGMEAYEFSLAVPPGMIVAGGRGLAPGLIDFGAGEDNWIVGTGGNCLTGAFVTMVSYNSALFLSTPGLGTAVWASGSTPSSFASGAPGYLVCNSPGDLRPFLSGPPFFLVGDDGGGGLPVLELELSAKARDEGIALAWRTIPSTGVEQVEIRRSSMGQPEVAVGVLIGPRAVPEGSWLDATASVGTLYTYRVAVQSSGQRVLSEPIEAVRSSGGTPPVAVAATPRPLRMLSNLPNPFNPRTELRFVLEQPGDVLIELFDGAGRRVWSTELPGRAAGESSVVWDGRDEHGREVVSGVYHARVTLRGSGASDARAVTLVR